MIGLQDDVGHHLEGLVGATLSFMKLPASSFLHEAVCPASSLHQAVCLTSLTTQLEEDTELEAPVLLHTLRHLHTP